MLHQCLLSIFDTGDNNIGFEELVAISIKVFQTFPWLRLEEEDEIDHKSIDDIKNFDEELRQWLEERAREVDLALLAEMPFFMI